MHAERPEGEPGRDEAANPHGTDEPEATNPQGTNEPEATGGDDAGEHESAYSLLQRGQELMRRRHNAQAAIVLERAARAEPGKGSILEALGRAYYNSGQHDRSRATFEALLDVDPSAHYAHYALGQSLKQLGRPKEARTHLRLAVALSPESTLYRGALNRLGPPPEE
jgi:tetratricopeptide (TPR) repeat protein